MSKEIASNHQHTAHYKKNSLTLIGAVSLGTGVMIGAGIFALTGQVAELAGEWFPFAFLAAAVVTSFSAYSYVKMSNAYPSAGGIAMFLEKAYGRSVITYTLQLFDIGENSWLVPALGVGLLCFAFFINILSNRFIQTFSFFTAFLKIGGIAVFAITGLWISELSFQSVSVDPAETTLSGFLNSGGEITDPHKNVGRAIIISIAICVVVYTFVALAVGANLTLGEIVNARDYALAEAARPAFGDYGLWFTVAFAIIATVSGVIASAFAVSRMLAMLTEMKLVPHSHFGMPGGIQKHTLVYTIAAAMLLTIFFDLSRIAALGAILYIIMDIIVHWGVLRHVRKEIGASAVVLITAIVVDIAVLGALLRIKASSDITVVYAGVAAILLVFIGERIFLRQKVVTEPK